MDKIKSNNKKNKTIEISKSKPFITMVEGRMVNAYSTLEEAQSHIKFQKDMGNNKKWTILYLKDIEFINY